MRPLLASILCLTLLLLVACSEDETADYYSTEEAAEADYYEDSAYDAADDAEAVPTLSLSSVSADGPAELPDAQTQRRIIYNADIDLVVDDFTGIQSRVAELVNEHGGFIAASNIQGSEGAPRSGQWTLRIPSGQYDGFVDKSQSLGQIRSISSDSREVTAEFVDLEARARNARTEEQRLHRHLEENAGSLEDILRIEREISRVRGEIERMEGRLNVLRDLTSLSTITLNIEEIQNYVPEPTEEPGFSEQVARTWDDSTGAVGNFFSKLSLFLVALTPWLTVLVPIGIVGVLVGRRLRKAVKPTKLAAAGPPNDAANP